MSPAYMPLQVQMMAAWGAAANLPPACAGCASDWSNLPTFLGQTYPGHRFALVSSDWDSVIGPYFGMQGDPQKFQQGLDGLAQQRISPEPNWRVFFLQSYDHVWTGQGFTTASAGGVPLVQFVQQEIDDDPAWSSIE